MFGHQDDMAMQPPVTANPLDNPMNNQAPAGPQAGMPAQPNQDWQHPGSPINPMLPPQSAPAPSLPALDDKPVSNDDQANDLIDIKQQALNQLSPLVGHLDQSPEEKFRTTMMMIQASDDQKLIKSAYQAAQQITDEKARAQALLDVVNEINYFTQHAED